MRLEFKKAASAAFFFVPAFRPCLFISLRQNRPERWLEMRFQPWFL